MEEEDEFWQVALQSESHWRQRGFHSSSSSSPSSSSCCCLSSSSEDDDGDSIDSKDVPPDANVAKSKSRFRGRCQRYRIPCVSVEKDGDDGSVCVDSPPLTLKVCPLLDEDGVLSSQLGSHAWHSSAVLAAILLNTPEGHDLCRRYRPMGDVSYRHAMAMPMANATGSRTISTPGRPTFLELGSGAVGLAGLTLAAAAAKSYHNFMHTQNYHNNNHTSQQLPHDLSSHSNNSTPLVILTDNDHHALQYLRQNVADNLTSVQQFCLCRQQHAQHLDKGNNKPFHQKGNAPCDQTPSVQIEVQPLDWNNYILQNKHGAKSSSQTHSNHNAKHTETNHDNPYSLPQHIDVIIGSELVYTPALGVACASLIRSIMLSSSSSSHDDHHDVDHHHSTDTVALIVQVIDRDGFLTDFIPLLQQGHGNNDDNGDDDDEQLDVTLEIIPENIYRIASDIVAKAASTATATAVHGTTSGSYHGSNAILGGTTDRFAYGACWIRRRRQRQRPEHYEPDKIWKIGNEMKHI